MASREELLRLREKTEDNLSLHERRLERERKMDEERRKALFGVFKDVTGAELTETQYQRYLIEFKEAKKMNFWGWIFNNFNIMLRYECPKCKAIITRNPKTWKEEGEMTKCSCGEDNLVLISRCCEERESDNDTVAEQAQ